MRPEITALIDSYAARIRAKMPRSVAALVAVNHEATRSTVTGPYWLSVVENGRKPRRSSEDHRLYLRIYAWMDRKGLFESRSPKGKLNEAKSLTWYINKYGTKQYRERVYKDVYTTETRKLRDDLLNEYGRIVQNIASDLVKF